LVVATGVAKPPQHAARPSGRCGWRFPARIAAVALVIVALLVADSLRCVALVHWFGGDPGDDGVVR
jgi:hypothetical protein